MGGAGSRTRSLVDQVTAYAVASAYLAGWRPVRLLPERWALALFRRIADRIHARNGRVRTPPAVQPVPPDRPGRGRSTRPTWRP